MILGFFELFFLQGGETSEIQQEQNRRRVFKITFSNWNFFDTFEKLIFPASQIGFLVGNYFI